MYAELSIRNIKSLFFAFIKNQQHLSLKSIMKKPYVEIKYRICQKINFKILKPKLHFAIYSVIETNVLVQNFALSNERTCDRNFRSF